MMVNTEYTLWCAVWELTLACNLQCIHCGATAGQRRINELTTEEALNLCNGLSKIGCRGIALMGGEPFLRKDWFVIAKKIRELNIELSVITNGFINDTDIVSKLKELKPRSVAISIDAGSAEIHDYIRGVEGSYEKAWNFIKLCQGVHLPLSIITTVHKKNIKELAKIRDMVFKKRIAWQIQVAGAEGKRFPQDFLLDEEEFYSVGLFIGATRKKYKLRDIPVIGAHDLGYHSFLIPNISLMTAWDGCEAGISVLGIQSNGNIKGCLAMSDDFVETNVRDRNIIELWDDPEAFAYNRDFYISDIGENCKRCEYKRSCRGGCNEMSAMLTGKLHNDPYCFYRIEQKLFEKELDSPYGRFRLNLRRKINRSAMDIKRIWKVYAGR